MAKPTQLEKDIYRIICTSDGIRAREIAGALGTERSAVNRHLYSSPLMHELCYPDRDSRWHALLRQKVPHDGLFEFTGYYSTVLEFQKLDEGEWMDRMQKGCENIGRPLSNARGLLHSFRDCRITMLHLFSDLNALSDLDYASWEIAFELRIKTARYLRIYADVLLISDRHVFSLEFKMKDSYTSADVKQAAKYCQYEDLIFGDGYEIVPVLVLTGASDLYRFEQVEGTDASIQICSGDMLYNALDEYLGFLN